jgi:TonB-dependent starch-binding outer membrane protein SusC
LHDYNNDGKITPDKDKVVLGDVQPDFSTGFGTNVIFKGIDLNISFNGVFGQKLLNTTYMSIMVDKRLPTYNVPDKALTDKVNADPLFSDYWIENGSFLRLQQITLGYSIPFKANGWVKKVRIYVTGENLHVWTKYSGLDPELNLEGLTSPGIEFYDFYPRPRTFSFGLNVSF